MYCDSISDDAKSELIDSWVQFIIDTNRTDTQSSQKRAVRRMSCPPRSPSPPKRRRVARDNHDDYEEAGPEAKIPRATRVTASSSGRRLDMRSRVPRTPTSGSTDTNGDGDGRAYDNKSETASSVSQRSGRSSPVKREVAMRHADDLPLQRRPLDLLIKDADAATIQLIKDLSRIRQKIAILPARLKAYPHTHIFVALFS